MLNKQYNILNISNTDIYTHLGMRNNVLACHETSRAEYELKSILKRIINSGHQKSVATRNV